MYKIISFRKRSITSCIYNLIFENWENFFSWQTLPKDIEEEEWKDRFIDHKCAKNVRHTFISSSLFYYYKMEQAVLSTLKDYETSSSCLLILCKNTIALENRKMIEPLIKSDNRIYEEALLSDISYFFWYKSNTW